MTTEDDDGLITLLRWAGRRPAPPEDVTAAVYRQAHRAWQAQVRQRQARRRSYAWAAGVAALALACWGAWNQYPHQIIATVAPGHGVLVTRTLWHSMADRNGGDLFAGDALETRSEGVRLQRPDGSELSVAEHTRLSFPEAGTVRLQRGRLYVQTSGVQHHRSLVVSTDLGTIEHLGTQFMAARMQDALLVAVRDGQVAVHYPQHEPLELVQGQAARVGLSGELRLWELAPFDSIWDWADGLAAPLAIDGQSLHTVLSQIAQRSGLALQYSTPDAETEARNLTLHGAPLDLQPRDALRAVLATTSLTGSATGREIVVGAR